MRHIIIVPHSVSPLLENEFCLSCSCSMSHIISVPHYRKHNPHLVRMCAYQWKEVVQIILVPHYMRHKPYLRRNYVLRVMLVGWHDLLKFCSAYLSQYFSYSSYWCIICFLLQNILLNYICICNLQEQLGYMIQELNIKYANANF